MINIQRIDEGDNHHYLIDGKPAIGITSMLNSEGLAPSYDFASMRDRMRGTAVHTIAALIASTPWRGDSAEEIVRNSRWNPEATAPVLVPRGYAFALWLLKTGFRPELIEKVVGSARYSTCGTLDFWGRIPSGLRWLVDIKSGQPAPAAHVQTALYSYCLEETTGLKTDERAVVWLKNDGTFKMYPPRPNGGTDLVAGQSAINCFLWRQANRALD